MTIDLVYSKELYNNPHIIRKGMEAGRELGCCSCEDENCTILTTSMIVGGIIGTAATPALGPGTATFVGIGGGFVVGMAIISVKESIRKGKCVLL